MKRPHFVRTLTLAGGLLLQLSTLCFLSRGAAGDVDLSFDPGSGVDGPVHATALQADGKVIIFGEFTTVKGLMRSKIARLNADGSGDSSFNAGTAPAGWGEYRSTYTVALQADGKVLVGHDNGISRLNADGSQDFNVWLSTICNDEGWCYPLNVSSIAVQSDGKVLIGGGFAYGIARLNTNGSFDNSFSAGVAGPFGSAGSVSLVALQPDGKVLVGGNFTTVNGTNRNGIARLNTDGSLDLSFNPGTGVNGSIRSIALQPDGKVLVETGSTIVNGTNHSEIARLNADGSLDGSFSSSLIWVSPYSDLRSVVVQSDGKVLIGGGFTTVNGTNRHSLARLNSDGSLDVTFNPGTGVFPTYPSAVKSLVVQSNGKVLIAGDFTTVNGTTRNRITRLNADGGLDGGFDPGTGVNSFVRSVVVQPDGKVLVGGLFTFIAGTNRYGSARLNADGRMDSSFISHSFPYYISPIWYDYDVPAAVAVQSDGKVLVSGYHVHWECITNDPCVVYENYFVARYNANGTMDPSFERAVGSAILWGSENVQALAVQPDGKIMVAGTFNSIKGTDRNSLARLNANGSLDSTFNAGTNNLDFYAVALQPDGKVLVGGYPANGLFTNGNSLARLNANGTPDNSFYPGPIVSGEYAGLVRSIAVQPDGKVLIGGSFATVNGTNRNRIARLNANGSLDNSFNPGTGADNNVSSIALQPDGKVLIGGWFFTVNGVVRPYVARLHGDSVVVPSLNIARSNAFVIVSWPVTGLNFQIQEGTDLSLPNAWSSVTQTTVTNGAQISVAVPVTVGPKFFRLKSQ
jgi:uncharacterized delta-60 repeat protein